MQKKAKKFKLGSNQRKWLKALKSKKYRHTTGTLCRRENGRLKHCCLGVACEIFNLKREKDTYTPSSHIFLFDNEKSFLPQQLINKIGLNDNTGMLNNDDNDDNEDSLVSINDESKQGYRPIINLIEKHPKMVFNKSV